MSISIRTEKIITSILAHSFPENNEIDAIRKRIPNNKIKIPKIGMGPRNNDPIKSSGMEPSIPRIARMVIPVGLVTILGEEENVELPQFEQTVLEKVFAVPQFWQYFIFSLVELPVCWFRSTPDDDGAASNWYPHCVQIFALSSITELQLGHTFIKVIYKLN